jgi:integrase
MDMLNTIPEYLLGEPALLALYCYLLRRVRPESSKVIVGGGVAALAGYEVCESTSEVSLRIGQPEAEIKASLSKLADLDLIELSQEGSFYRIRFRHLVLPHSEGRVTSGEPREYEDCWFDEFAGDYLEYAGTNLAPKTRANAARVLGHFSRFLGRKKLSALRGEDLENFKRSRKGKVQDSTINIDTRTLKAALEIAVTWGRIKSNPFRPVKLIRTAKKQIRPLSRDEFTALIRAIKETWLKDIVRFAVLTGLRRGEIMNLKWIDVDLERNEVRIVSSDTYRVKHGKIRVVPLADEAKSILSRQVGKGDYVFVGDDGKRLRDEFVSKKVKNYMRELSLPEELHFHSLRATFASWCHREGVSKGALQDLMGHSSVKTTELYTSLDDESLRSAVKKIVLPSEPYALAS